MTRTLVFDVEADGLLDTITKLHCMAATDVDTGEEFFFGPDRIKEGLAFLEGAGRLIAHNGLDYDCPAIEKLYPAWKRPPLWDTLIFVKMVWPADLLVDRDMARVRQKRFPPHLLKRQSMEAWGYRLGVHKVGAEITDWSQYTDYMGERNKSDVAINLALWKLILKRIGWDDEEQPEDKFVWSEECFELEHQVAEILRRQEATGFAFNKKAALKLAQGLTNLQAEHAEKLKEVFGGWWAPLADSKTGTRPARAYSQKMAWLPDVTIPRVSPKTGKPLKPYVGPPKVEYSPDAPFVPIEWTEFNPSSRLHLGQRLVAKYGWKPAKWGGTHGTQPVVDEGTIDDIPPHILPPDVKGHILDYFVVTKTLGQLCVGRQSWLSALKEDGRIHGRIDPLGAITARATHNRPNIAQVPSVSVKEIKDAEGNLVSKEPVMGLEGGFGFECRSLFEGLPALTGTDAAGLELRGLGHHLYPFDGGAFAARASDPSIDIHLEHAKLTGLSRAATKTCTYAYVYGAGPWKLGLQVGYAEDEKDALLASKALAGYLTFLKRRQREAYQEPSVEDKAYIAKGLDVIKRFEQGIEGIKDIKKALAEEAGKGWLKGLDGRKVYVRKAHAALNTRLQSDGAIICKRWMVELDGLLKNRARQVAWVHDELQFEHEEGLGEVIAEASRKAMTATEEHYGYLCHLATSASTGRTWADTH